MAISLRLFTDPALTVPLAGPIVVSQAVDESTGPVERTFYLGSNVANRTFEVEGVNQGVDNLILSILDDDDMTGQAAGAIKLSLTEGGLGTAIAGDPLDLATASFQSGTEADNFIEIWVEFNATNFTIGTYTDLHLNTQNLVEF